MTDETERLEAEKRRDIVQSGSESLPIRQHPSRYSDAQWAGYDAGGRIPINRGVGGDDPKLIGGSK